MIKSDYSCSLNAHRVVAEANMDSKESLLQAASDVEESANNDYYDDDEGCKLMLLIAQYYRNKAKEKS